MVSRLALAIALLCTAATGTLGQQPAANLVGNPSLEGALGDAGLPSGWVAGADPVQGYTVSVVPGGHTGKKALLIAGAGDTCTVMTNLRWAEPGKRYLARGWVKVEGQADAMAVLRLGFMGVEGRAANGVEAHVGPSAHGGYIWIFKVLC